MVGFTNDQVPIMRFGSMEDFHSFICGVNVVSIGENMKVPPANERDLKKKHFLMLDTYNDT